MDGQTHTHTVAATLFSVSRNSRENSTIKGLVAKLILKVKMCNIWTLRYEILM